MGKIEIDHTGSGGGITLSSDGTDLLLDGTAIGGALELYAENPSSPTAPSATGTNAVAIGTQSVSSGLASTAIGRNAQAQTDRSIALGDFSTASGTRATAISSSAVASGQYSTAIGNNQGSSGSRAAGTGAMALGGSYASGIDSFAAAIANNTSSYGATGTNSVAIGFQAKASAIGAVAIGYGQPVASANLAFATQRGQATGSGSIAMGHFNTFGFPVASGQSSIVIGDGSSATEQFSVAFGNGVSSKIRGKYALGGGRFSSSGDAQTGIFVLRSDTTDATPEALTTNNSAAGSDDQIILPNNSAYAFHGTIVAREQASAGTDCAAWKIEGLIRREGSAGTTVLVNSATTVIDNTPSWGLALSADTTNGGLKIEVTGAAATNIRWVATVHTSEVTY